MKISNNAAGVVLIVAAVGAAIVLLSLAACAPREYEIETPPKPSRILSQFSIRGSANPGIDITEFRDSVGRLCVLAHYGGRMALDCGNPAIYRYEDLPSTENGE